MFDAILPQFGITTKFVKPDDPQNFARAITPKTRALFIETIGNPALDFTDVAAVAKVAHEHGLPLIVDATFTTPYLLRTIEHGADIVVNSLTKWLGGHGTAIGGIVTDSGRFDWKDKRFSLFNEPDPNYHGLRWAHDLPAGWPPSPSPCACAPCRCATSAPASRRTTPGSSCRGSRPCRCAWSGTAPTPLAVAQWLKDQPKVDWVRYPGLPEDPSHEVAARYLKKGFGGMVVFGIKGGRPAGEKFIDSLQLFSHLANVGDAKSLAIHPATTTHSQLSEEQQRDGGVTPELVRLSIGLEHVDDILADLEQALRRI